MYGAKTTFYNPANRKGKTITSDVKLNQNDLPVGGVRYIEGPADTGSSILTVDGKRYESGIALSPKLMKDLSISEGDVIYFKITGE